MDTGMSAAPGQGVEPRFGEGDQEHGPDPRHEVASVNRLIGVGLGPGDPELLTVKAVRVLLDADVVLVPQTEQSAGHIGRAERIILQACPEAAQRIRRVTFAMREPRPHPIAVATDASDRHESRAGQPEAGEDAPAALTTRAAARDAAAAQALACFADGARVVAMATIGDPSVYSTFSYLAAEIRRHRPDTQIEVVPGITAMQAMAAATGIPLVEGDQTLALIPATAGLDVLERALSVAGAAVVAYKGGRQLPQVRVLAQRHGRLASAMLGTDLGLPSQQVAALADVDPADRAPYFSTLFCPAATSQAAPGRPRLVGDDG